MHRLSVLLHELIDHAVPQGNRRGELHTMLDRAVAEETGAVADDVSRETPAGAPEVPATVFTPPKPAKSDGAAAA